jgi:hypothetical protein
MSECRLAKDGFVISFNVIGSVKSEEVAVVCT